MIKTQEYVNKTGKRAEAFALMLNYIKDNRPNPLIIETGCARKEDNFDGDGMSTLIFDSFITELGQGEFHSVDILQENVDFARTKILNPNSKVHCSDSVKFLYGVTQDCLQTNRHIDLLYLDSFDFDPNDPHPSSLHHIYELTAAIPSLKPGSLIAVDDNFGESGKGAYVKHFMDLLGKPRVYEGYQWIWVV